MSNILEELTSQFGGSVLESIGSKVGLDSGKTGSVLSSALPFLVQAMARNASKPEGAQSLDNALAKDHDGSILDNLAGFLGGSDGGPGAGILKHVLGGRRGNVENAISKQSGVDSGTIGSIMEIAAPMVMGMLGRKKRSNNLDAGGLAGLLQGGADEIQKQSSQSSSFINNLLDQDGDGEIMDDVASIGMGFLGKLLGGK